MASAAVGCPAGAVLVGPDAVLYLDPPDADAASEALSAILQAWQMSHTELAPWPTAVRTGLAWLADTNKAAQAFEGGDHSAVPGEGQEPCLARLFPDFASLSAEPDFQLRTEWLYAPLIDWLAAKVRIEALPEALPEAPPGAAPTDLESSND
jgi:exodeoxyribonuclease V gamma subunit